MKTKNIAIIDTETAGLKNPLIYDFGMVIINQKGEVLEEYESLVRESFIPQTMATAHYNKKIHCYYSMMYDGMRIRNWDTIRENVNFILDSYNVGIISAYNLVFDKNAISKTNEAFGTHSEFFEKDFDLLDLWLWSAKDILSKRTYHKFADTHNLKTEKGNYKTSAETSFAFLNNLPHFVESHTALDDCYIEADIMKRLLKRKIKKPLNEMKGGCWRLAQPTA